MEDMEDCFFDSVVRGHHVFKSVWTPSLGEVLSVKEEEDNEHASMLCQLKRLA